MIHRIMKIEPGDYGIFKLHEDGRLEAFGLRVVFFRIETRASIRATILDLLGKEGGSVVLRLIGERIGKDSGTFAKERLVSKITKELFEELTNIYLQSGRGKREYEVKDNEIVVRVHNSFEADAHLIALGRADEPSCFFVQGYLKGFFSAFLGKEVDVKEVKCKAQGNEYCEFHVKFRFLLRSPFNGMYGRIHKYVAFALIIIFVLAVIPQKPLDEVPSVEGGPGPADYVVKPVPTLEISGNHIYVRFDLGGKQQTVHGIVYGKSLGSSPIIALYLPGFRRDAEKSINDFKNRGREPDFTLIVLDPPGKGETTGPAQELDNVLGDGVHPNTSYIRRYIEFAYATILAFYYHGTPIEYVAGHSMGATTIMGLITIDDPALEAVKFYAPMAIAGFRLQSIHDGTFLNRFTKDTDRDTRLIKYFDVAAFPDKVRYPVIMINGMHDRVYSIRTMVRTAKILDERGKLISHVLVPDAGHRMCKEFAETFEARVHVYAENAAYEIKSEIVYDNDYRHYTGSVRLTPADYKFSLTYTNIGGEKVYMGSSVVSDRYSIGYFLLYFIVAIVSLFVLAMMNEFVTGIVTMILGYRRFRDPGRFLVASFGKLFRFRIPLQILITALFVTLSRRNRRIPIAILLIGANVISVKLMHSVVLPGPYLAALIVLRLLRYTRYRRYIKMIDKYVARACRRFYNRFL